MYTPSSAYENRNSAQRRKDAEPNDRWFCDVALASRIASELGPDRHLPTAPRSISGTATDVTNAEIQAAVQKTSSAAVLDQALRVVNINGEYNVGIGVVHRNKTTGPASSSAVGHSEITEVYHVISGNGTLVTGGSLENPKATEPDSDVVKVLVGPSTRGDKIQGGVSREDAYALVQRNAMPVWRGEGDFLTLLKNDKDVRKVLGTAELEELFDLGYHLKNIDFIFERVFGKS